MFDFSLLRRGGHPSKPTSKSSSMTLPLYSPLSAQTFDDDPQHQDDDQDTTASSSSPPSPTDSDHHHHHLVHLQPAQRHAALTTTMASASAATTATTTTPSQTRRPSLSRFLADFTLGFADGLTVPFALTAGLSSLGQSDTVIYAGMAEICAGSISMGIGGYLSARGEEQQQRQQQQQAGASSNSRSRSRRAAGEEQLEMEDVPSLGYGGGGGGGGGGDDVADDEKKSSQQQQPVVPTMVDGYLAPLHLPPELLGLVREHIRGRPDVATSLAAKQQQIIQSRGVLPNNNKTTHPHHHHHDEDEDDDQDDDDDPPPPPPSSPILSGLSVALGYLIGGSLPLAPYLLVSRVGDGLKWSFVVCVLALFAFGFAKDLALHLHLPLPGEQQDDDDDYDDGTVWVGEKDLERRGRRRRWWGSGWGSGGRWGWSDVRRSAWEGLQMVLLGSLAALAAVLCVRLFEGMGHDAPQT